MKKIVFLFAITVLGLVSCKKETIEPIQPAPVPNVVDTTGTSGIDYGNDNNGTQIFPQFALKVMTNSSGSEFNCKNTVDSIIFTNYSKNYVKSMDVSGTFPVWQNVTSPYNGNGIGYSIPEAIIESGDSCNISIYFNNSEPKYCQSEMGFTDVNLISENGIMLTPTHYSHTDHY